MGPSRNPNWSTSGMRVTLSYLTDDPVWFPYRGGEDPEVR
jgi:hypothetical protein